MQHVTLGSNATYFILTYNIPLYDVLFRKFCNAFDKLLLSCVPYPVQNRACIVVEAFGVWAGGYF